MSDEDLTFDVVIIGSGGGALTAALRAATRGLVPLVVEKTEFIGGSTAMSGGGLWVPNNPLMKAEHVQDSPEAAMAYFDAIVGDVGPSSSPERRHAYIDNAPKMIEFIQSQGVVLRRAVGWPDYYPEAPGGSAAGRTVEPIPYDTNKLGPWKSKLRPGMTAGLGIVATTSELMKLSYWNRSITGMITGLRVTGRTEISKRRGQALVAHGGALVAMLLAACAERGVTIWTESPFEDLVVEDGRVVGARVVRDGDPVTVRARRAVLLAAGGYARNQAMRDKVAKERSGHWSMGNPGETGEVLQAAINHGAATAQLDEALWTPGPAMPDGSMPPYRAPSLGVAKNRPGAIMVDQGGERFVNESTSHMDIGQAMLDRSQVVPAVPSWVIFDDLFRRRYTFDRVPGKLEEEWVTGGYIIRGATLEDLAKECKIEAKGLVNTVEHWNTMAHSGHDEDFHRGDSAYDRFQGDPRIRPNNCMAPLERPPYYAVAYFPGDVGTLGGVVTDEHARVLDEQRQPIAGLYATGNITATVMGRVYPGGGASIAHTCTFGLVAMDHVLSESPR